MIAYQWNFGLLLNYLPLLTSGALVTLAFTFGTIALGILIGLIIGMGRLSRFRIANMPLMLVTEVSAAHHPWCSACGATLPCR